MSYRYTFRLQDERDSDLVCWLNSLGKGERSFFIRQALRKAIMEVKEDRRPEPRQLRVEGEVPVRESNVMTPPMNIPEEPSPDETESKLDQLTNMFE